MTNKNRRKWIIAFAIILIGLILYSILREEKEFKTFEFPETVEVNNQLRDSNHKIDTVSMVIINKILKYDTVHLNLFDLSDRMTNMGDYEIQAHLQQQPFKEHTYSLFLNNDISLNQAKKILSHEMVHLDQFEKGKLVQPNDLNAPYIFYNDNKIYYSKVPYRKRAFEKDAHDRDDKILKKLNNTLYKD